MDRSELKMLQALPLDIKIAKTKLRIKDAINEWGVDGVYIPVSGGMDSTVLSYIVEEYQKENGIKKSRIPRINVNTGCEYDGVLTNARKLSDREMLPKKPLYKVLTEEGYPVGSKKVSRMLRDIQNPTENNKATVNLYLTGIKKDGTETKHFKLAQKWRKFIDSPVKASEKCCYYLKKEPMHRYEKETKRHPLIAEMASEGGAREGSYLKTGCNAFKTGKSKPMGFWLHKDVLAYVILNNVEYPKEYGEIVYKGTNIKPTKEDLAEKIKKGINFDLDTTLEKRTGCVYCTFGVTMEKGENRFQRLKKLDPRKYNFAIYGGKIENGRLVPSKGLGMKYVLDLMGIKYDIDNEEIEDQISIFDEEVNNEI